MIFHCITQIGAIFSFSFCLTSQVQSIDNSLALHSKYSPHLTFFISTTANTLDKLPSSFLGLLKCLLIHLLKVSTRSWAFSLLTPQCLHLIFQIPSKVLSMASRLHRNRAGMILFPWAFFFHTVPSLTRLLTLPEHSRFRVFILADLPTWSALPRCCNDLLPHITQNLCFNVTSTPRALLNMLTKAAIAFLTPPHYATSLNQLSPVLIWSNSHYVILWIYLLVVCLCPKRSTSSRWGLCQFFTTILPVPTR